MVVQERECFRGKVVPLEEWKIKLQQDFPFMEQDPNDDGHNIYRKWGFECYGGWYRLLRECCEAIVKRYEKDGIGIDDIDFVPAQIKEKFGTLRLYYRLLKYALAILAADPRKIIYFPLVSRELGNSAWGNCYDAVLCRPELQLRRSEWVNLRRQLDRNHRMENYVLRYDPQKLCDEWAKIEAAEEW